MSSQSRLRLRARVGAAFLFIAPILGASGFVAPCAGDAVAQSALPLRLAALTLHDDDVAQPLVPLIPASPTAEPFGRNNAERHTVYPSVLAKWRGLQPALRAEAKLLQACRGNPFYCTSASARFLKLIDAARAKSGRARIGEINRAVNLAIKPVDDMVQFHAPDVWTTPLMTFASGRGDCEDYAIAKYAALREAGVATADLRIVILNIPKLRQAHAVVAAHVDGQWIVLDNRTMIMRADNQLSDMTPLVSLDDDNATGDVAAATRRG